MGRFQPRRLTQDFVNLLKYNRKAFTVRDTEQKGFMVVVNQFSKSFVVQRDLWQGPRGKRRLAGTRRVTLGRVGALSLKDARDMARESITAFARGEDPRAADRTEGVTLREAWNTYKSWLERQHRSSRTIDGYKYYLEKYLKDWLDRSLTDLGKHRKEVRERHGFLTKNHGPYLANSVMRSFRAVYRHELQVQPDLPVCPVISKDMNPQRSRETFISPEQLSKWWAQVRAMRNPVRRDLQLFILLTGMRRGAASQARWEDFNEQTRVLRVPRPKGGETKAFDLPLCDSVMDILIRRQEENQILFPRSHWIFPAHSKSGHVSEPKEVRKAKGPRQPKDKSLPSPHVLRHTFSTHATAAGVSWADKQMLLNHAPPRDVTGGYTHPAALVEHLRKEQEKVCAYILDHVNNARLKVVPVQSRKTRRAVGL